jgi:hypothetical protein
MALDDSLLLLINALLEWRCPTWRRSQYSDALR